VLIHKPKIDPSNPHFKSSPYYSNEDESLISWQLFDINKNDNIRSKDWIVRSVLEPSLADFQDIELYIPEMPSREKLETLKQKCQNAQKRDQQILEQHYISARRQVRERIQSLNSTKSKMSIDSNHNNSPKTITTNTSKNNQTDKTSKQKSNSTSDSKSNQMDKSKNTVSENHNFV